MPDIELRFGHDMLVLSSPIDATLARQGIDATRDRQYLNLMEPDAIVDAFRLELMAGAQCLVTTTEDITRARLAHVRMEGDASQLAKAAIAIATDVKPQHVLVEIGPCGLPLDASSKASLNENRQQYADAARAFEGSEFDAFFLNGFASIADLKCALMGVAQVSGKPVIASVAIGRDKLRLDTSAHRDVAQSESDATLPGDGTVFSFGYKPFDEPVAPAVPMVSACLDPDLWPEAIASMVDLGASVVGFETADPIDKAVAYAQRAVRESGLPVLAQLCVGKAASAEERTRSLVPLEQRADYSPDTLERAAVKLYGAGVQFLRATGVATPACTGALAATVSGLDVLGRD